MSSHPESDPELEHATEVDPTVVASPLARSHPPVSSSGVSRRGTGSSSALGGSVRAATVATPAEVMELDERSRSRQLARVGIVGSLATILVSPIFDVDTAARIILYAGMGVLFLSNVVLFWLTTTRARYAEGGIRLVWAAATVGLYGAVYFFGPLSAATMVPMLGLYFVGHRSTAVAVIIYVTVIIGHFILVVGAVSGAFPDVSLVRTTQFSPEVALGAEALVQLLFLGVFVAARSVQSTLRATVGELDVVARQVAQREAQLDEARQDFQRAMRVGGPGRLTGAALGSYQLGNIIGRGAMGEVYEGTPVVEGGEPAAVKVLQPHVVTEPQYLERFLRESRAAASLASPYVVRILEVGAADAPIPYIAMERLYGHDLATQLRERGRLGLDEVVELARHVAAGLDVAASAGIVHRDVKPQNVFLSHLPGVPRGTFKLLDFGVSKLAGTEGTLTSDRIVGTPVYMAPEQANGDDVDHRADVYALGAVVYRCLTGRPLFRSAETARVVYLVVHRMPPRPGSLADLPDDVDLAMAVALAKKPADRFQSASELVMALEAAAQSELDDATRARARRLLERRAWGA